MNEFSFYENLKTIILEKYENLINGRLSNFFDMDENFNLALSLSYFVLSEDSLISEFKNAIKMSKEKLDYLFTKDFCPTPPIIYKSDNKKDSKKNFQNIRNSFLHSNFYIDFEQRKFKIINETKNFICDVPFDWITEYMDYHILSDKEVKRVKIQGVFETSDIYNRKRRFNNIKNIKDYIDMLYIYRIEIKSDDVVNKQEVKAFVENYINKHAKAISNKKIGRHNYQAKWQNMKEGIKQVIKEKYPNTRVYINVIKDLDIAKKLDKLYNTEKNDIFKENNPNKQCHIIVDRLNKFYNKSKDDLIKAFEDINTTMKIYNNLLKNNKEYQDIINYILNSKGKRKEILEFIHTTRKKKELPNTYDNVKIGKNIPLDKKDKNGIRKFFARKENINFEENYTIKLEKLKDYNPSVYRKYKGRLERNGFPSDEDIELYNSDIIKSAIQIRSAIQKQKEEIDLAIIYTLGISTYAINKEKDFNKINFEDIAHSKMEAYSIKAYKKLDREIKYLQTRKEQLEHFIKVETNTKRKNTLKKDLKEIDSRLNKTSKEKTIEIKNQQLAICKDNQIVTMIRDCFSHLSSTKIRFSCYKEGKMELITNDGFIKCNVSSLINFITNDIFSTVMKEKYETGIEEITSKNKKTTGKNHK